MYGRPWVTINHVLRPLRILIRGEVGLGDFRVTSVGPTCPVPDASPCGAVVALGGLHQVALGRSISRYVLTYGAGELYFSGAPVGGWGRDAPCVFWLCYISRRRVVLGSRMFSNSRVFFRECCLVLLAKRGCGLGQGRGRVGAGVVSGLVGVWLRGTTHERPSVVGVCFPCGILIAASRVGRCVMGRYDRQAGYHGRVHVDD